MFRFTWNGKQKDMGLGRAQDVPLARAREKASEARAALANGLNPIEQRQAQRQIPLFGKLADELIASMRPSWRNEKHAEQWEMTLTKYAAPIRDMPVDKISTEDVLKILRPMWAETPETANRLRSRIERVLDAAKAQGFRQLENPARWRGHLSTILPARKSLSRGHHKAMPFCDVPDFLALVRQSKSISNLALEFTILTAARSGETRFAAWREFDLDNALWTIPADRMKGGREHRVPLVEQAIEILRAAKQLVPSETASFVFPGAEQDTPLSEMALAMALRRLDDGGATVHGFRSSFRDWAGELTQYPREVAEAALSHIVGDQTERAYRRGDALEKRRGLMDAWAQFCDGNSAKVVRLAG